jgi:hypothetical protein
MFVDYLIVGQGDLAFPRLFEYVVSSEAPKNIPNVYYQTSQGIEGTTPEVVQDLDALPFPEFSQMNLDGYFSPLRILPVQSSRGCSWGQCAFCSHEAYSQGTYKTMSISRVINLLEHIYQTYNTSFISFHDAEIPPSRIEQICDGILASSILKDRLNVKMMGRFDRGFLKSGFLEKMAEAGVVAIEWGLESGNQRILNLMRKGIRVDDAEQIVEAAHAAGIHNALFMIWGFPGETQVERQDSIDFIHRHQSAIDIILSGKFFIPRLSPMGKDPDRWGVILDENGDWKMKTGDYNSEQAELLGEKMKKLYLCGEISTKRSVAFGLYNHFISDRNQLHITSGLKWIQPELLIQRLDSNHCGHIFPIIPGTFVDEGSGNEFIFYDFSKPYHIDAFVHKKSVLSSIEKAVTLESDGTKNISEILQKVSLIFGERFCEQEIQSQALDYFRIVFENSWGLAFRYPVNAKKSINPS